MATLKHVRSFRDLVVDQKARHVAKQVFELTKGFPDEERWYENGTDAGKLKLPEIGGKAVNLNPAPSYQSPFMSSVPGTEKVRTSFGSHVQEYDFGKATSTEVNNNPKGSTQP